MQLDNEIKLEKITLYTATQIYDTKNNTYGLLDMVNLADLLPSDVQVLAQDSEEYTLTKKNKEISNVTATDPVDSCPECEGANLNTDATKCWDCSSQN